MGFYKAQQTMLSTAAMTSQSVTSPGDRSCPVGILKVNSGVVVDYVNPISVVCLLTICLNLFWLMGLQRWIKQSNLITCFVYKLTEANLA